MKFSTREDVEAPIEAVYLMLSDFERFERAAPTHGGPPRLEVCPLCGIDQLEQLCTSTLILINVLARES